MAENPLKIVSTEKKKESWASDTKSPRQEAIAKFNRLWLINPQQFNPLRNCLEEERIERTVSLFPDLKEKKAVDLGCGSGVISRQIRDRGASVDAVDVAVNALKELEKLNFTGITPLQDYVPRTKLKDDSYDLVVAADLVAYLPPAEYRLFMSELARLVKPGGKVVCSTPIDIYSTDSLERFVVLSETEFQLDHWIFSHHKYWLKLNNFLDAPARFSRAGSNADYRNLKLQERKGFSRSWFIWNSSAPLSLFWKAVSLISVPIHTLFKNSRFVLLALEKLCKAIASQSGISHAIWIGIRRPLVEYTPPSEQPKVRLGKQQVWE